MKQQHLIPVLLSISLFVLVAGCSSSPLPVDPVEEVIGSRPRALHWLQDEQNDDGSWGKAPEAQPALTSLSVLAFLSYGETPASEEFGPCVENAMRRLLAWSESGLPANRIENEIISTDAIVTWAMCASYEMTRIPMFIEPTSNAVQRLMVSTNQSPWVVPALKAAQYSGDTTGVTKDARVERMRKVVDRTTGEDSLSCATRALAFFLTRSYVNERGRRRQIVDSMSTQVRCDWKNHGLDYPVLTWFLCSSVFFCEGGKPWNQWSREYYPTLVRNQWRADDFGYWDYPVDTHGKGRKGKNLWKKTDADIYATTVISMSFPPSRTLPAFRVPASRYDAQPDDMDDSDIVIEIEL